MASSSRSQITPAHSETLWHGADIIPYASQSMMMKAP